MYRTILLLGLVLLVPVLPFLAAAQPLAERLQRWIDREPSGPAIALGIVALLSTDVFLPIPSSVLSTWGGARLGTVAATAASWAGMSAGAVIGFAVARRWGRPLAARLTDAAHLEQMDSIGRKLGVAILVMTRPIPALAEASVLMTGIHHLAWSQFLPPVLLTNFVIALGYSAFGHFAESQEWLVIALCFSAALPLLLAALVRGRGQT